MGKSIKESMQEFAISKALIYVEGNPEENIPKLMEFADKLLPNGWYESQRNAIRTAIHEKSNWYQLMLKVYELDPGVRKAFFQNFIFNSALKGSAIQKEAAEANNCNVPW